MTLAERLEAGPAVIQTNFQRKPGSDRDWRPVPNPGGTPMIHRFVVVPVLALACMAGAGCLATRNFVRENLQQSETKIGQNLGRLEGQVGETRGVADEAGKRATEATQLAGQAGSKAD